MENQTGTTQMEEEEQRADILFLPDEILIEIIKFLPFSSELSQTCRKFYELFCSAYNDYIQLDISYLELCDCDLIESLLNSSRKFRKLTINLRNCSVLTDLFFEKIMSILKKFGPRLRKFKLWNSIQSKATEILESQLYEMLSILPELDKFIFRNIYVKQSDRITSEELNLHKLRKLSLDYCIFDSPDVLLRLPANTISEMVFTFEPFDPNQFQEFFNRQGNIKKLEMFENEQINFAHLQLEHLKISSSLDFAKMIQQQPKLQYLDFAIAWVNDETIEEVCKLKHLKFLKTLIDLVSIRVFREIQNLSTLKELRLDSHTSYDMGHVQELSLMRGMTLEKITLLLSERRIIPETVLQMANNFHQLKHVELINRSISILDSFIQYFPNLESILLDFFAVFGAPEDTLQISNNQVRHNLKQLVVTHVNINEEENTRNLLQLVDLCPQIERLMLSQLVKFSNEHLRNILENHSSISHFSIDIDEMNFDEESVDIILTYGKNLKYFRMKGFKSCLPYKVLKVIFIEKFPNLNIYKYSSGEIELVMKKRNIEDWQSSFKLMNHF